MGIRRPAWPIYDVFDTADSGQVFVGVVTDSQWQVMCQSFGLTALAGDPALRTQPQRQAARSWMLPVVVVAFGALTKPELMQRGESLGLPFAPIAAPVDLFDDPHLAEPGGMLPVTLPDGRVMNLPGLPLALDGEQLALRRDLPSPGQHNEGLMAELGWLRGPT